ncbi:hypothetical protein [Micromonospora sp. NPDC047134]|uniref:hypothetical protein n=1 Tax=Micromonospora sp. NPDC047134 TaxID=3154340 RepID=UPI0033E9E3A8
MEFQYIWTVSGTASPGTPPELVDIDEEGPDDTLVRTRFSICMDTPPLSESPVKTLHLEEAVEFSRRFALIAGSHGPEGATTVRR